MSDDTAKLHASLKQDGIDPGLKRICRRCHRPRPLTGYQNGKLTWTCQTPSCVAVGSPHLVRMTRVQVTCDACGDPEEHQLAELSNGDQVFTCRGCNTMTLLEVTITTT